MKLLVDMNLSPGLCEYLQEQGWEAVHWSAVGKASSPDGEILQYAKERGYVVVTHDLDFGAILSATGARAPSVIQVRTQDVLSARFREVLVGALRQFEDVLRSGALAVVDEARARVRVLPLKQAYERPAAHKGS